MVVSAEIAEYKAHLSEDYHTGVVIGDDCDASQWTQQVEMQNNHSMFECDHIPDHLKCAIIVLCL